jgi:membrane protease subunit (stomatin/prohibitin family)
MANIVQIIKYEGDTDGFIWKHPTEDFNTGSQLLVHESQEALFFLNGQALDLFGPGRHTLETQNIPLIRGILNKPTEDQTPFHCEVYFINKTEQLSIKWGTDSKVQYMEPVYKFPLQIGASGEMSLRVEDSRKLLVKIVGTGRSFTREDLTGMFRLFLQGRIKPYLARIMGEGGVSIFETDARMGELSQALHTQLSPDFGDYGLAMERFFVTTVAKPDGDRAYEKFKEIHLRQYADVAEAQIRQKVGLIDQQTEAQRMVIEADALAEKRKREGFSYQQERSFDVAEKVAQNEGAGNFSNMGIGLGMMGGVAAGMGATVAGMTSGALAGAAQPFTQAANPAPDAPDDLASFKQKIEKLKALKDSGLLSDEEFEQERKKLLETL